MMIPDYLDFTRYQDKRLLPLIYLTLLVLWGLLWKNNGYALNQQDAGAVSGILAIVLFYLIHDLKAYWMYKGAVKGVDLTGFSAKPRSRITDFCCCPLMVCAVTALSCWLLVSYAFVLLANHYAISGLYCLLPLLVYLIFRGLRVVYIRQLSRAREKVPRLTLYRYTACFVLMNSALNHLTVSPLKNNPDFSLEHGWLSPQLTVAMFILCVVVFSISLLFARVSKKYLFFGRMFLQEIDFSFSAAAPCALLQAQPLALRLLGFVTLQMLWIMVINALLALLAADLPFSLYFLICYLPASACYFLHLYWQWHTDFMTACDMYLRWSVIDKRATPW
ncbi:MAG: hypothetical protein E7H57_05480 [Pantoea sp.]|nr:hypothetical protein [Pantoea sp.]